MKMLLLCFSALVLTGCARPHAPAEVVLDHNITVPKQGVIQSKVTVTRNKQFIGGGSGGLCKFKVSVDDQDIALLRQNQFIITYLNKGPHKLRVSNDCTTLSMGMRKTLDIISDGTEQEYVVENGVWGQYRMWRVN